MNAIEKTVDEIFSQISFNPRRAIVMISEDAKERLNKVAIPKDVLREKIKSAKLDESKIPDISTVAFNILLDNLQEDLLNEEAQG